MVTVKLAVPFLVLVFVGSPLSCRAEDWTTTDGKTYKNIKVIKHDDATVTIIDEDGGATVPLANLPPDLQKKFNYDPAKAAAAIAQQQAAIAQQEAADKVAENAASGIPDLLDGMDKTSKAYQMLTGTGAEYSYDKFKETSSIKSKELNLGDGVTITFYVDSDTKDLFKPSSYYVLIYSSSDDWRFLNDSDIDIKADKDLIHRESTRDSEYSRVHDDGTVSEMLDLNLSSQELGKVANCSTLAFRISVTEFDLAHVQKDIKVFFDATQSLPDKPPITSADPATGLPALAPIQPPGTTY